MGGQFNEASNTNRIYSALSQKDSLIKHMEQLKQDMDKYSSLAANIVAFMGMLDEANGYTSESISHLQKGYSGQISKTLVGQINSVKEDMESINKQLKQIKKEIEQKIEILAHKIKNIQQNINQLNNTINYLNYGSISPNNSNRHGNRSNKSNKVKKLFILINLQ